MVQINFALKQINAKVVYYGPGMSGKTTNLEIVHQRAPNNNRGDLTSISTDGDRTLFFDYMPLDLGTIAGMKTCFQMYTVPGQVYYNSTRKLVLQGVDGVIFVADSSPDAMDANREALRNLEENLNEYGKSLATLPHVVQFNKRDLPEVVSMEEMEAELNPHGAPTYEAVAFNGQGVFPTLKGLATLVLRNIQAECAGGAPSLARTNFTQKAEAAGSSVPPAIPEPVAETPAPMPKAPVPAAPKTAAPQPVAAPVAASTGAQKPPSAAPRPQAPQPARKPEQAAGRGGVSLPELDVVSPKVKGDPMQSRAPSSAPRAGGGGGGSHGSSAGPKRPSGPGTPGGPGRAPVGQTPAKPQAARPSTPSPAISPRASGTRPGAQPASRRAAPASSGGSGGSMKAIGLIAAAAVIGGIVAVVLLKFV